MSQYNKFDQFIADQANGSHNLSSDQLTLFLTNISPVRTNAVIGDITEIDYTNLSSLDVTTASAGQVDGKYTLMLDNITLTASDIVPPFRYVGVYNSTQVNPLGPLIQWSDTGAEVNLVAAQTFDVMFDQSNGFLTEI